MRRRASKSMTGKQHNSTNWLGFPRLGTINDSLVDGIFFVQETSRISFILEGDNLTVDKLKAALRARSLLALKEFKKDLASRLIEHQRKRPTQGSAESLVEEPP
jgi:hypothetical protein